MSNPQCGSGKTADYSDVFGNKSIWNSEMENPKPTKKFMEMAINRCVERNGGYLAE